MHRLYYRPLMLVTPLLGCRWFASDGLVEWQCGERRVPSPRDRRFFTRHERGGPVVGAPPLGAAPRVVPEGSAVRHFQRTPVNGKTPASSIVPRRQRDGLLSLWHGLLSTHPHHAGNEGTAREEIDQEDRNDRQHDGRHKARNIHAVLTPELVEGDRGHCHLG